MMTSCRPSVLAAALLLGVVLSAGCGDDKDTPSGPGEFPDVRGLWTGQYSVTGCTILSGTDPFFCQDLFYEGSSRFLDVQLNQSRSSISGTAWQGQVSGQVEGTVTEFGIVTLTGQIGVDALATTTIEDWETVLVGDSLVGSWTFLFEENTDGGLGSARIDADLTLIDPNVPNFMSCPVELTLEQTDAVLGLLEAGDCQLVEDESYYDVFSVDVAAGDQIEIRMSSADFLPVLFIVDLEQRGIACSAPTGTEGCTFTNTPDSVAAVALEAVLPETWLIVVNTAEGGDAGGYSLTTRDLGGAAFRDLTVQRATLSARYGIGVDAAGPQSRDGSEHHVAVQRFIQPTTWSKRIKQTAVSSDR
jgi:hypothetical protein